jgi:hypothetical protein
MVFGKFLLRVWENDGILDLFLRKDDFIEHCILITFSKGVHHDSSQLFRS